ncbi:hypothetical protein GJ496_002381 [Pomphorhynchus laevis]|nr:hypothetical protein GJ496_002381 [Pomphorhynchus laevis]
MQTKRPTISKSSNIMEYRKMHEQWYTAFVSQLNSNKKSSQYNNRSSNTQARHCTVPTRTQTKSEQANKSSSSFRRSKSAAAVVISGNKTRTVVSNKFLNKQNRQAAQNASQQPQKNKHIFPDSLNLRKSGDDYFVVKRRIKGSKFIRCDYEGDDDDTNLIDSEWDLSEHLSFSKLSTNNSDDNSVKKPIARITTTDQGSSGSVDLLQKLQKPSSNLRKTAKTTAATKCPGQIPKLPKSKTQLTNTPIKKCETFTNVSTVNRSNTVQHPITRPLIPSLIKDYDADKDILNNGGASVFRIVHVGKDGIISSGNIEQVKLKLDNIPYSYRAHKLIEYGDDGIIYRLYL